MASAVAEYHRFAEHGLIILLQGDDAQHETSLPTHAEFVFEKEADGQAG